MVDYNSCPSNGSCSEPATSFEIENNQNNKLKNKLL